MENLNHEYLCVVRTKSFADFLIKAHLLAHDSPSSSSTETLLNPPQETIESLLQSPLFSNKSNLDLKPLFCNYFNISAQASSLCGHLLKTLIRLQSNDQKLIDAINLEHDLIKQELKQIHKTNASLVEQLRWKSKQVRGKTKMKKLFNKGRVLRGMVEQLDVAAKGAYVLNRDLDTMGRLVRRIRDEIEHRELCMEKEEGVLRKQAAELEEHVCVCLLTINRARARLVTQIRNNFADN